jgi:hypothetical protein
MKSNQFRFQALVWLYPGKAGWCFVTLPKDVSDEIDIKFDSKKKGWGSLPVQVTIQTTSWKTSIFPDNKAGAYLLPVKAEIRKKEKIALNDEVIFLLEVIV